MPLEDGSAHRHGALHHVDVGSSLVSRVADAHGRIAPHHARHEAELDVLGRGGIHADAVQQSEVDLPVGHEAHEIVNLGQRPPAGRADRRLLGSGNALEQRPVVGAAAGHLDDLDIVVLQHGDRVLVEWRAHSRQSVIARRRDESEKLGDRQPGRQEPLHVRHIRPVAKRRMDERVQAAVLELDPGADAVPARQLADHLDDLQATSHAAAVVVGHLEDEETIEQVAHCDRPCRSPFVPSSCARAR